MAKKELDEFLEELNGTEGLDDTFDTKDSKDLFAEEETVETKEEVKEKPEPFHKNPKFKKLLEKNKELEQKVEKLSELEKFVKDVPSDEDELTEVLTRLIGNDSDEKVRMIKDFKKVLEQREDRAAERGYQKSREELTAMKEAEKQAENTLRSSLEEIEENFDTDLTSDAPIARKTRSEFISFIQRIAPKDANGDIIEYPDLMQTYEVFNENREKKATQAQRAKELSSRSMSKSRDAAVEKPAERITFRNLQKFLNN